MKHFRFEALVFAEERAVRLLFGLVPLTAFLFGHASLVAFLAKKTFVAEDLSLFFHGFEDIGGGVVEVRFASEGGGDPFLDELHDLDVADVGVLGDGDVEVVADLKSCGRFEGLLCAFDFTGLAGFRCERAGFIKPDGPKPFVDSAAIGHRKGL